MINLPGCIVLPPKGRQNIQIRKIRRYDISDTDISDLMIECFDQDKSCQKFHFKQHWIRWSTFQDASFSPQGSPKFSRFEFFKDLTNLTQIFKIWSYSVLIETKVVGNYILNNLYPHEFFLFCTVFPSWASKVDQTRKFYNFLNLTQFKKIVQWHYTVF